MEKNNWRNSTVKIFSLIKPKEEYLGVNVGLLDLKKILERNGKKFHFAWESENNFIISLKFSFGTNLLFDTNYSGTKSDIIATGILSKLTEEKTKITLKTKSKNGLIILFLLPTVLIIFFNFIFELGLPIPLYFIFPLLFILVLNMIKSEEKRLIKNFKSFLDNELKY
ncbi:MAG: hypothetical protein H2058_03290 [Muricauda sp.]|nr:hypothetical protein [Allomuricauda sp.]MBA4744260.1 hypothetical protein [Allomuricauda sp.]